MKRLFISMLCLAAVTDVFGWGQKGHDTVAYIAENHLSPEVAAKVTALLDGHSLVYYANWMDNASHTPDYAFTSTWHYVNVDEEEQTYAQSEKHPKGDVVVAINEIVSRLKNGGLSPERDKVDLMMLIHLVGDMHCPTHSYFPGPRCFWECTLNGKPQKSFHSVYDKMPELIYGEMSAEEVAERIDTCKRREIKKIQSGSLYDWVRDCADNNAVIYRWNPVNTETLDPNTVELSHELVDIQMRNAGYRLAYLLNEYFGE